MGKNKVISLLLLVVLILTSVSTSLSMIFADNIEDDNASIEVVEDHTEGSNDDSIENEQVLEDTDKPDEIEGTDNELLEESTGEDDFFEEDEETANTEDLKDGSSEEQINPIQGFALEEDSKDNDIIKISELGSESLSNKIKSFLELGKTYIEVQIDEDYTPDNQINIDLTKYEGITLSFNGKNELNNKSNKINIVSNLSYLFKIYSNIDNKKKNNIIFENLAVVGDENVTETGMLDGKNINLDLYNFNIENLKNEKKINYYDGSIFRLENTNIKISSDSSFKNLKVQKSILYLTGKEANLNIDGENIEFLNNESMEIQGSSGSVIYLYSNGKPGNININGNNISFKNNTSNGGSTIFFIGEDININGENIVFENNVGEESGVISLNAGKLNIEGEGIVFKKNESKTHGGAIIFRNFSDGIEITGQNTNVQFIENKSDSNGGALNFSDSSKFKIYGGKIEFRKNKAEQSGGALSFVSGNSALEIDGDNIEVNFEGNKSDVKSGAGGGGAIYSSSNSHKINKSKNIKFQNNESNGHGGAIHLKSGIEINDVENLEFINNKSKYHGGAIYTESGGIKLDTIDRVDFIGNTAGRNGGAIVSLGDLNVNDVGKILFVNNEINFVEDNISTTPRTFKGGAIYTVGSINFNNGSHNILFKNNNANLKSPNETDKVMGGAVYTKGGFSFKGNVFFINNLTSLNGKINNEALDNNEGEKLLNDEITIKIRYKDGSDIETIVINNFEQGRMKDIKLSPELKKEIEETSKLKFNKSGLNTEQLYELEKDEFGNLLSI